MKMESRQNLNQALKICKDNCSDQVISELSNNEIKNLFYEIGVRIELVLQKEEKN